MKATTPEKLRREQMRKDKLFQMRIDQPLLAAFSARCAFLGKGMSRRVRELIAFDVGHPMPPGFDHATNHAIADALEDPAGVSNEQWQAWADYLRAISGPKEPPHRELAPPEPDE